MDVTRKTLQALNGIPFDSMLASPLNACVNAQANAAQTTIKFIQEVGLNTKSIETVGEDGKKTTEEQNEAVYVYFNFVQNGRKVTISVPLLTIVPIPYIAINTIDISFKATVNGTENEGYSRSFSSEGNRTENTTKTKKGLGWFNTYKQTSNITTSYSTKRDSKATRDSSYSIEATIDVAIHANQDSMPAGMAKILEMLGAAIDLCDPNGELTVSSTQIVIPEGKTTASITAMYKTPGGLYEPTCIKCNGSLASKEDINRAEGTAVFNVPAGEHVISVGEDKITVTVVKADAASAKKN